MSRSKEYNVVISYNTTAKNKAKLQQIASDRDITLGELMRRVMRQVIRKELANDKGAVDECN